MFPRLNRCALRLAGRAAMVVFSIVAVAGVARAQTGYPAKSIYSRLYTYADANGNPRTKGGQSPATTSPPR